MCGMQLQKAREYFGAALHASMHVAGIASESLVSLLLLSIEHWCTLLKWHWESAEWWMMSGPNVTRARSKKQTGKFVPLAPWAYRQNLP